MNEKELVDKNFVPKDDYEKALAERYASFETKHSYAWASTAADTLKEELEKLIPEGVGSIALGLTKDKSDLTLLVRVIDTDLELKIPAKFKDLNVEVKMLGKAHFLSKD